MAILLILTFRLYRYLIISFLINRYKQTIIVRRSSIINVVIQGILFLDAYIQNIGNATNWIIIYQIARR